MRRGCQAAVLCCVVLCCCQPLMEIRNVWSCCYDWSTGRMQQALSVLLALTTHTHNSYTNKLVTAAAAATDQTMLQWQWHSLAHPPTSADSTPSSRPWLDAAIINLHRVKCDGAESAIQQARAPRVSISDSCLPGIYTTYLRYTAYLCWRLWSQTTPRCHLLSGQVPTHHTDWWA